MSSLIAHPLVPVTVNEDTLHQGISSLKISNGFEELVSDEWGQTYSVSLDCGEVTLHLEAPEEGATNKALYAYSHDDECTCNEVCTCEEEEKDYTPLQVLTGYINSLRYTL